MNTRRDWYECTKCYNQGYVLHGETPDPNWANGCSCEPEANLMGPHDWQPLKLYQNVCTCFDKYPEKYFKIN